MEFIKDDRLIVVEELKDNPHIIRIARENEKRNKILSDEFVLSIDQMQELIDDLQERIRESKINQKL